MKTTIEEQLKEIIAEQIGAEPSLITNETRFVEDLNVDSLDVVELMIAVEDRFNLMVEDEDAEKCATFGKAVELIERLQGK